MKAITAAAFSTLFCLVLSASLKVKEEHRTAFFGEDVHIVVPSQNSGEVLFKRGSNLSVEVVLLRDGRVVNPRAQLNALGHLVLEDVQEEDEGMYVIKNINSPADVKHLKLIVRDCALEHVVKYGDTYLIPLNGIQGPVTLEFRPNPPASNQSLDPPTVVLLNRTGMSVQHVGRLSVSEKRVALHGVRMADEGSFTVLDRDGKVRKRNCLNVREHQNFIRLAYGGTLKINLYLDPSDVNVVYTPDADSRGRLILERGVLVAPPDLGLEGRLWVEGSGLRLKKVRVADMGLFRVSDLAGFPVANVYLEVEAYKLPTLYVAILSLLGIIALLLLMCLLSCLYKVHRRNQKDRKLRLIAQQPSKIDGDTFRQVVHEAYNRFAEESQMQSTWENTTESTEVTIKGLEVSKSGCYQTLSSDKNFLEMSDSGVEFNSSALPLDSDVDMPSTYASHKPLLDHVYPSGRAPRPDSPDTTVALDADLGESQTPDSAMSASPVSGPPSIAATSPDGSLRGIASPGATTPGATSPGATLPGATLLGATSPGATFLGATSPGATLLGATTPGATTPGAMSPGATSPGATSPGATLLGATTPGAMSPGATLLGATLPGATTPGVTLLGATSPGVTLLGATSPGATLLGATSPGATLPGATLLGATTPGATLLGVTLPGATSPGATLLGATSPGATLLGVTLPGATSPGATLLGATTPGVTSPGATSPGATLLGATSPGATTPGATLLGATSPGVTSPGATLLGATLLGATSTGTVGSDLAKTPEAVAEGGGAEMKEGAAESI